MNRNRKKSDLEENRPCFPPRKTRKSRILLGVAAADASFSKSLGRRVVYASFSVTPPPTLTLDHRDFQPLHPTHLYPQPMPVPLVFLPRVFPPSLSATLVSWFSSVVYRIAPSFSHTSTWASPFGSDTPSLIPTPPPPLHTISASPISPSSL